MRALHNSALRRVSPLLNKPKRLRNLYARHLSVRCVMLYAGSFHGTMVAGAMSARLHMSNDKPIHEVRLGAIKATVWKNDTGNGVRFNTTFTRLYRDGSEWKTTNSFGRDDLLVVGKVADQAHSVNDFIPQN
jgi:hypothetical protein